MATEKEIKLIYRAVKSGRGLEDIQKGLGKVEKKAKKTFSGMKSQWMSFAKGILAVNLFQTLTRGVVDFVTSSTKAFQKQELAEAKLAAGIQNVADLTGKRTDLVKEDTAALMEEAKALQKVTTFGDEQIANAMAMLSTFALQKDSLKKLTPRLLDMAASVQKLSGTEVELQDIAVAVGKSMTMGAGALGRYGIVMSDVQREAFNLAEGEEKINVLTEIMDQNFKGFAEGSALTSVGRMKQLSNQFGDFKEKIGSIIADLFDKLIPALTLSIKALGRFTDFIIEGYNWLGELSNAIAYTVKQNQGLMNVVKLVGQAIYNFIIEPIKKVIGLVTKVMSFVGKKMDTWVKDTNAAQAKVTEFAKGEAEKRAKTFAEQMAADREAQKKAEESKQKSTKQTTAKTKEESDAQLKVNADTYSGLQTEQREAGDVYKDTMNMAFEEGVKKRLRGEIQAWGAAETAKAFASAPMTMGGSLASLPIIAAAVATGLAAINAVKLAKGGIVTRPTNAIIGEAGPEAVIPLNKGGIGANITIQTGAFMGKPADARAFAKMVKDNINKLDRRNITV